MKEKFKKVKDRPTFYRLLAKLTGCEVQNVSSNWFARSYLAVPKDKTEVTETFLDKYLQFEQEKTQIINQIHEKYFGKN